MARSPRRAKYYIRVGRPRIETAIIEVDAADDDDARQQAVRKARRLPATSWTTEPFDPAAYQPHVACMVTGEDFDPPVHLDRDRGTELLEDCETRYLLLRVSSDEEVGDVVLQPWLVTDRPDLLVSDLMRDWIASLQHLGLTHLSERLDDIAAGDPPKPSDRILVSTPRRQKRRD